MPARFKNNINRQPAISKLNSVASSDGNSVQFKSHAWFDIKPLFYSLIELPSGITNTDRKGIISRGIHNAIKVTKGNVDEPALLKQTNLELAKFNRQREKKYYLFTGINIRNTVDLPVLRLAGCTIKFITYMPHKVRSEIQKEVRKKYPLIPHGYYTVRVHTSGKSIWSAAERALDSLCLFRGILNLGLNPTSKMSSGEPRPVNEIRLSKYQTLHNLDLTNAIENSWWFEPDYVDTGTKSFSKEETKRLLEYYKHSIEQLKRSKYRKELENIIRRYATTLDLTSKNSAFLGLFSLLEHLTYTKRKSYDTTINRAAFLFVDQDYQKAILEGLRANRNSFVHEGNTDEDIEPDLYNLKHVVEVLIRFHLFSEDRFNNIEEFAEFLDMPRDRSQLRTIQRKVEFARKHLDSANRIRRKRNQSQN